MRPNKRTQKYWLFVNLILLALLGLFVYLNIRLSHQKQALKTREKAWQKKLDQLRTERQQLLSEISASQTKQYLEKVARDQLNLRQPGEKVVAFKIPDQAQQSQEQEEEKKNLLQKILDKIK